jgi:hypothetical protein
MGLLSAATVYTGLANGGWTPYGGRDDLPKTEALIVAFTDSRGQVWFGYAKEPGGGFGW